MTLNSIFKKPVGRPIEGVIKADDDASLRTEIEEYILTKEVESRLEAFLDSYNTSNIANGVWVSGFFGSGKSHLLKMLAFLLENREIDGVRALDLFLPKCPEDNEILRADLKRAVAIPSKSILFNIDQKADVISKTQVDALLAVFVKVFDELSGYYGKQGYIAQFERELDSEGNYGKFKAAYAEVSGKSWQKGREQALLESNNIAKAYAKVKGEAEASAIGILDKYRAQYRVSIEDFAEQVKAYIDRQPPNFRLNFFVDEVGQYIASNTKLMTNLQTIAESLATKCKGRSWVIVTAQEEMNTVVGEMNRQQGNDFSKIQARFANRMKLTSADVAEVIQKRLLAKNDDGVQVLTAIYHAEANNFKTLFDFADGATTYQNFKDRDDFIHSYPFIPYQFALFQLAIQNLSQHNAFEGKHSSVGERSMLGVFQQVAMQICDLEPGRLATFGQMFEGIRTVLKSKIQSSILQAEHHLGNEFAIQLLKALFLVKYIKGFNATPRNLCVLMLSGFGQDVPQLRKMVEESLNLLEQQTYVQRNGETYEYLTDEEKDVEQEIKNTSVESSEVIGELNEIIFDHFIKTKKIRYPDNSQDYPFSRKIDERLYGKEYELAIHIISPFFDGAEDESNLIMLSLRRDEVIVVIPSDDRLMRDLTLYKQTAKYVRQNVSSAKQESIRRILADKSTQNDDRYKTLQERIYQLLGKSQLFVPGAEFRVDSEDGLARILRGFHELISLTYPNLRMLPKIVYSEADISKCLKPPELGPLGEPIHSLSESERELLAFIQSNHKSGVRSSLKSVLEKFERKPYGWYYAAVLCTVASLCALGKLEISLDGNLLAPGDLERSLRNTHAHANLLLDPQPDVPQTQIRKIKVFYESFFDSPPRASEPKALGLEVGVKFQELMTELRGLVAQSSHYPFLVALTPVLEHLKEVAGKPYGWYLADLLQHKDVLLDLKESIIDPIRKFMSGPQKNIFDNARKFSLAQEPNFAYIEGDGATKLSAALSDPECFKGNRMQLLKVLLEGMQQKVKTQLEAEVARAKSTVRALQERLLAMADFSAITSAQQQQISKSFSDFAIAVESQPLIAVIRDKLHRFEDVEYQQMLSNVGNWAQPVLTEMPPVDDKEAAVLSAAPTIRIAKRAPVIEYVPSRLIHITFDKAWLADEADVDGYLKSMRKALLAEIRLGKRIQI